MGRCLFLEYPKFKGGLIDLDSVQREGEANRVRDELLDPKYEDCVALRDDQRYVSRLEAYRPAETPTMELSRDGAYLITGGLGALGLQVARFLADRRAGCLVLMGRSAPSDQALKVLRRLEEGGSHVFVVQGDVTDEAAVAAVQDMIGANSFTLKGIVHAAGVNQQRSIAELEHHHLLDTLAPKIVGL